MHSLGFKNIEHKKMRIMNNMKLTDDLFHSRLRRIFSWYPQSLDGHWSMSGSVFSGRRRDSFPEGKAALFDGCLRGYFSDGKAAGASIWPLTSI